jgi:glycosyltransferase involved in cell wall biosynthesis
MIKPRVLLFSTSLNMGGSEKFLYELAVRLKHEIPLEAAYVKDKGHFGELLEKEGIKVTRISGVLELAGYLRRNNFNIVHSFLYRANIIARFAALFAPGTKVICTQQAIDRWKPLPLLVIDILTSRLVDLELTNSSAARDSIARRERIPAERIRVVYNGLDMNTFKPSRDKSEVRKELGIPFDAKVVVYAGRLHTEKGTDFIPEIAKQVHGAHFLIIGDGDLRDSLERMCRQMGLYERFKFTGWRQDIADLFNASDIFLLPSREESFPQVLLEAMAMRLAVVARDIGGVRELVVNNETGTLIIRTGSPLDFSVAINYLITNPAKAEAMGSSGRAKCASFTRDRVIQEMKKLYEEV